MPQGRLKILCAATKTRHTIYVYICEFLKCEILKEIKYKTAILHSNPMFVYK